MCGFGGVCVCRSIPSLLSLRQCGRRGGCFTGPWKGCWRGPARRIILVVAPFLFELYTVLSPSRAFGFFGSLWIARASSRLGPCISFVVGIGVVSWLLRALGRWPPAPEQPQGRPPRAPRPRRACPPLSPHTHHLEPLRCLLLYVHVHTLTKASLSTLNCLVLPSYTSHSTQAPGLTPSLPTALLKPERA